MSTETVPQDFDVRETIVYVKGGPSHYGEVSISTQVRVHGTTAYTHLIVPPREARAIGAALIEAADVAEAVRS